jgi:ADP-ribosylglycohydrolase
VSAAIDLDEGYAAQVYAGVLGKFIGVYLGRPVEGWPYERIREQLGQLDHFVNDELGIPLIVADDDISGTLAFARVVDDAAIRGRGLPITPDDVGKTWLNYIIEDRTILWWGGFGRSTEHTAYLNLRNGIPAPRSGSIEQNGSTLAEQIGAQIFSDAFALMHPGDPASAVALTRAAASVSHDGVALDAAAFFAAMRAEAFRTRDLDRLTDVGRGFVTDDRLRRIVDEVSGRVGPSDEWREVRDWVDDRFGYARFPGPCHALSNTAMTLAALRLGGDDFRRAVMVAASAGFDTDSNAGTVGCLNGVRLGIEALAGLPDLREPIADRAVVVSADGGEAVTDAAREALRIVDSARYLRDPSPVGPDAAPEGDPDDRTETAPREPRFGFALPGAVHGFESCPYSALPPGPAARNDNASTGRNGLTVRVSRASGAEVSTPTFLDPRDAMSNFSTLASPTLYPTDEVRVSVSATGDAEAWLYALYAEGASVHREQSEARRLGRAATTELSWEIPARGNLVPFRLGLAVHTTGGEAVDVLVHAVDWAGAPAGFRQQGMLLDSIWDTKPAGLAPWVSSARNWEADFGSTYCVSHPGDLGVVTIGTRSWTDYRVSSVLTLSLHRTAGIVLRARGHRDFTAAVFSDDVVRVIDQVDDDRTVVAEAPFAASLDTRYHVDVACLGDLVVVRIDGVEVARGASRRAGGGGAGFLVEGGTFTADSFTVARLPGAASDQNQRKAAA